MLEVGQSTRITEGKSKLATGGVIQNRCSF